jgi:hypothetical protein
MLKRQSKRHCDYDYYTFKVRDICEVVILSGRQQKIIHCLFIAVPTPDFCSDVKGHFENHAHFVVFYVFGELVFAFKGEANISTPFGSRLQSGNSPLLTDLP